MLSVGGDKACGLRINWRNQDLGKGAVYGVLLDRSVPVLPYSLSLAQTQGISLETTGEAIYLFQAWSICLDSVGAQEKE